MKKTIFLLAIMMCYSLGAATFNYLDSDHFGFEDNGWYLQHPDYWSYSSAQVNAGSYAMRFSAATANSDTKKIQSSDKDATLNLSAGKYILSMNLFIDSDYTGTGFNFIIKESWLSTTIDFSTLEKGKWVSYTKEIEIEENIVNSRTLLTVSSNLAGVGTFYVDDITLLGEKEEAIPLTSSITTNATNGLTLATHFYTAKLNVWIEEGSDLDAFYTIIDEPYTALKWDLSSVSKSTWVELEQDFYLKDDAINTVFKITVPNRRGAGSFYVDELSFTETEGTDIVERETLNISVYPNPSQGVVNIKTPTEGYLSIYSLSGKVQMQKKINEGLNTIDMNTFGKGLYLLRITNNGAVYQEKLIVE